MKIRYLSEPEEHYTFSIPPSVCCQADVGKQWHKIHGDTPLIYYKFL